MEHALDRAVGEMEPRGHRRHFLSGDGEYDPAGQSVHLPSLSSYCPATHPLVIVVGSLDGLEYGNSNKQPVLSTVTAPW